jgi:hypothetical protein
MHVFIRMFGRFQASPVVTFAVFALCMFLLIFGDYFAGRDRLVLVSIALGPVAMVSVMVGYAVWWAVLFLLTLLLPEEQRDRQY